MTDQESPENLKSPLPPEMSPSLLLSRLSSLTACLTEYTEIAEVIPPKIDDVLESLERIEGLADNESLIKDEHLEKFVRSCAGLDNLIKRLTTVASSFQENFQKSNDLVANIHSLKKDQDTTQSEYKASLSLLIANIEKASSSLHDAHDRLTETIHDFAPKVEKSVSAIQLDAEKVFSRYASQFQTLNDEWRTLQFLSNQTIEECNQIISAYQNSQADLDKNISQTNINKNKLQKFIDGLNNLFESRLLVTSIISSLVTGITVFALGLIAVKIFLPQESSSPIKNSHKDTSVKPFHK